MRQILIIRCNRGLTFFNFNIGVGLLELQMNRGLTFSNFNIGAGLLQLQEGLCLHPKKRMLLQHGSMITTWPQTKGGDRITSMENHQLPPFDIWP